MAVEARRSLPVLASLLAAGCTGDGPGDAPGEPWFEEVGAARGLDFVHESGHAQRFLFPEIMGGGAALFDMDGDGDLDAYLVQSGSLVAPAGALPGNQLYENDGEGRFRDVTSESGAGDDGYGMGVAAGDYDADGDVDLYVTNVGPNVLLRNEGDGRFTDVSDAAGVASPAWGTSAAFLDYDADGQLDLFVVNYVHWSPQDELDCATEPHGPDYCNPKTYGAPAPDTLYRNRGDGTFVDVSAAAGLRGAFGNGLGVICSDFDANGHVDVFVANDGLPNQLWLNAGDGTFADGAVLAGCAVDQDGAAKAGMGVAAADVDDDGDEDLLVVNFARESDSYYSNEGRFFKDRTPRMGLAGTSRPFTRFGCAFADFDNDGYLDLYQANGRVMLPERIERDDPYAEANLLLRGAGADGFEEVSPRGGTRAPVVATSRAAAFGDVDGDGGVDVLVVNRDGPASLMRNVAPSRGHWVVVRAVDASGSDVLGAVVTARAGQRLVTRVVRSAFSYQAANDPRVHLGLGRSARIEDVRVLWPDGSREEFGAFDVDRSIVLQRGEGR